MHKGNAESFGYRGGFPLKLSFRPGNLIPCVLILIASPVFLIVERFILMEEEITGKLPIYGWYTLGFVLLTLFTAFLFLIDANITLRARRITGTIIMVLLPVLAFIAVDFINDTRIFKFPPIRLLANYLCYLMVFSLIFAISRRVWITALVGGFIFLFFGIANFFVVQYRGQPVLPWDFQGIGTALTVVKGYSLEPTRRMAMSVLCYLCVVAISLKFAPTGKEGGAKTRRILQRAAAGAVALVLFILIFPANILSHMDISVWAWNQKTSSELTGVTAGFFANVQYMMVEKPEGYSEEQVEKMGDELDSLKEPEPYGKPDKLPTIIGIMNESFTDMANLGDLEFVPDNAPFLHSLFEREDIIWGTAYSSVYGGNTCNSEYEFLTGNTTAFMPTGCKPYQQYMGSPQTSLASILGEYGYSSTAIHPGERSAWSRDKAYPSLGFDKFISLSDLTVPRKAEHGLTSDAASYRQVIEEFEQGDETAPQFIFNVTIQNHGGYEVEDYPAEIRVRGHEGEFPQAEQYLTLIKHSDEALQDLIEYFEGQDEPVVIIFFGDHWPNLEEEFTDELLGADSDNLSLEDAMREYEVPFFIWANYPLKGEHIERISLNYLSGLLLRAAGIPGTDYTRFLENLRGDMPVITAEGMIDSAGKVYASGANTPFDEELKKYDILEYNNVFGEDKRVSGIFTVN